MTYDAKAEAERLLEPFSVEYVEYDPDKMGDEHPRDAFRNAIAAALTAARVSMREEAAAFVERVSDRNDESEIGEQITEDGYNAAPYTAPVAVKLEFHGRALAAAIRSISSKEPRP